MDQPHATPVPEPLSTAQSPLDPIGTAIGTAIDTAVDTMALCTFTFNDGAESRNHTSGRHGGIN